MIRQQRSTSGLRVQPRRTPTAKWTFPLPDDGNSTELRAVRAVSGAPAGAAGRTTFSAGATTLICFATRFARSFAWSAAEATLPVASTRLAAMTTETHDLVELRRNFCDGMLNPLSDAALFGGTSARGYRSTIESAAPSRQFTRMGQRIAPWVAGRGVLSELPAASPKHAAAGVVGQWRQGTRRPRAPCSPATQP